jgi:N-acetyltransferase
VPRPVRSAPVRTPRKPLAGSAQRGGRGARPFDAQPTLHGELIDLRPLRESDYAALFAVASDPYIWEQHPDKTRSTPEGFRRFFRQGMASRGALLVTAAGSDEVLGSSRYNGYDAERSEVEIGWTFLARACWGGTFNQELKQLMVNHAFRFVRRVLFVVDSGNLRSQQAVLKLGAARDGSRFDANGAESYVYALTPEAWGDGSRYGRRPPEGA